MGDPLRRGSGRMALVRCRATEGDVHIHAWGPLLVHSTSQPLPDRLLLPVDSPLLAPMHPTLRAQVERDSRESLTHAFSLDGLGDFAGIVPGMEPGERPKRTRVEPRRLFVKGRDPVTRLTAWIEQRIFWVDVAIE